jgi:hypothetical protein
MFQTAFYFIEHEDVVFEVPSDHGGACALQSRLVMEFFIGTAVLRSSDGALPNSQSPAPVAWVAVGGTAYMAVPKIF